MKRILLAGLISNTNLGDRFIYDCTNYLINCVLKEKSIEYVVDGFDMENDDYSLICNYDMVIFAGGGIIKYKYQRFYEMIDNATEIADKYNIPVYICAAGVEGYSETDERCQLLKGALNRPSVVGISTRDDIDTLNSCYVTNNHIHTAKVADPALWTSQIYCDVNCANDKKPIGVNAIREGVYESNKISIGRDAIFEYWAGILNRLDNLNEEWYIYTNGYSSDYKFAVNLMKYMNRENDIDSKILPPPSTPEELVKLITGFRGIITGRLHSNIISCSYDIPTVGIIWNDKLKFWGSNIGYPERYFDINKSNPSDVSDALLKAVNEGYTRKNISDYRHTTVEELSFILNNYL